MDNTNTNTNAPNTERQTIRHAYVESHPDDHTRWTIRAILSDDSRAYFVDASRPHAYPSDYAARLALETLRDAMAEARAADSAIGLYAELGTGPAALARIDHAGLRGFMLRRNAPDLRYGLDGSNLLGVVGIVAQLEAREVRKSDRVVTIASGSDSARVRVTVGTLDFGALVDGGDSIDELGAKLRSQYPQTHPDRASTAGIDSLARLLPAHEALQLLEALRRRAIAERDDDGPLSRAFIDAAESIERADYFGSVGGIARDVVEEMVRGTIEDEDDLRERIDESVDGSAWCIYTARAHRVLHLSSNESAYEDSIGESGASVETRAAYAMIADVWDAVREEAGEVFPDFDENDPDTWRTAAQLEAEAEDSEG